MTALTQENVRAYWRRIRTLRALRDRGWELDALAEIDDVLKQVDADLDTPGAPGNEFTRGGVDHLLAAAEENLELARSILQSDSFGDAA